MRPGLVQFLRDLLRRRGLEVVGRSGTELRRAFLRTLEEWAVLDFDPPAEDGFSATGIVFSRDRAMQLHALLSGWTENVDGEARFRILWTASTPEHEASYRELEALWGSKAAFVRESDFRDDLRREAGSAPSSHLFFLTDDAMVLRPFRLADCLRPRPSREIFSLTHGEGLEWCFVARRSQRIPPLERSTEGTIGWAWADGEDATDWAYPLSVDGKFFSAREMATLLRHLPFRNPNTLEAALQVFQPLFRGRRGAAFSRPALVNVPCNTVQSEFRNHDTGLHTASALLSRWNRGERIRHEEFLGLSPAQAEIRTFTFVSRR